MDICRPEDRNFLGDAKIIKDTKDLIIALFVVVFDTRKGNDIEWKIPDNTDLDGVEFKALVSGSHTITEDFVYFRHKNHYGLSCFSRKAVNNDAERGARMKSVGIICAEYTSLHEHQEFLENQVIKHLENAYDYKEMTKYYIKYRRCPHRNNTFLSPTGAQRDGFLNVHELPVMKISHPIGCFSQFIKYFGERIFVLWKFLLLQKRVLFFAPPPVGVQCYRVYCTSLLGSNALRLLRSVGSQLLFYVSVCNLSSLTILDSFVACTTENIFESKAEMYDLFVNKQKMICHDPYLENITKINSADSAKFKRLKKYSNEQLCAGVDVLDDEKMYTRFFIEQNNRMFKILYEIASRADQTLTSEHVKEMGLDPSGDRVFLTELIDLYDINVVLSDAMCC